jgi:UDP-glucose 4-epimerase
MDMVHVRDVARANILAARAPATDVVFNVGSESETSLIDLARELARAMGRPDLVPVHEAERSVNPVPRRLASGAAAARELGFQPVVDRAEGVRDLVSWWRSETAAAAESAA